MPVDKFVCCQGGEAPVNWCRGMARSGACLYPEPLLNFVAGNQDSRLPLINPGLGPALQVSATELSGCHRRTILEKTRKLAVDPETYLNMFVGTGVHEAMDKFAMAETAVVERRFGRVITVDGQDVMVHGKPDYMDPATGLLVDYKTTGKPFDCDKNSFCLDDIDPSHVAQLNVYAWILDDAVDMTTGEKFRSEVYVAKVYYIGKHGKRWAVRAYNAPLWSDEVTERYISGGVTPLLDWYQSGRMPAVLFNEKQERHWMCRSCQARSACDHDAKLELALASK